MKGMSIEERAIKLAQYIIDTKDTVRGAAKRFGISKSTVHMDVTQKNGWENKNVGGDAHIYPFQKEIEIRKVFFAEKRNTTNSIKVIGVMSRCYKINPYKL